jgi:hypothetical protein
MTQACCDKDKEVVKRTPQVRLENDGGKRWQETYPCQDGTLLIRDLISEDTRSTVGMLDSGLSVLPGETVTPFMLVVPGALGLNKRKICQQSPSR